MGRRKIEIQRISDDRNRAVTFIKRKAGLFKKAHELSVLCQVDIAVIILGSNNTFYEFSSVDTNDLIEHYQNNKNLLHEVKDPSDYGDFHKSASVNINQGLLKSSVVTKSSESNATAIKRTENGDDDENDEGEEEDHVSLKKGPNINLNIRASDKDVPGTHLRLLSPTALISKMDSNDRNKRHHENALPPLQRIKRLKPDPLQIDNIPTQQQQQQQQQQHKSQQGIPRPYHNNMYNLNQPSSSSSSPSTMDFPKLPSFQNSSFNTRPPPLSISPDKFNKPYTSTTVRTPRHDHKLSNINTDNSTYTQSPPNSLEDSIQQTVKARRKLSARPVLRVRIPNNNFSSNSAIQSEPSSASSASTSANGSSMGSSQIMKENRTSRSSKASPLLGPAPGPLTLQKGINGRVVIKLPDANTPSNTNSNNNNGNNSTSNNDNKTNRNNNNNINSNTNTNNNHQNHHHPYSFGNGSSPLFSATQPYIATPLQPSNIPGGPFQQNTSSFLAQRQAQQYQQLSFKKQSQTVPLNTALTGRPPPNFSGSEHSNGPPTGSLPSKFVHDLMSNSPNVSSIPMFSDWAMGPNSAKPGNTHGAGTFSQVQTTTNSSGSSNNNYYNNAEEVPVSGADIPEQNNNGDANNHPNPNTYDAAASSYNGNTGLTPYINTAQTPLGTKFFNFSTDISGEKNSNKI
ncbi:rlm1p [Saccharomyces arboricola H-6]|uniref:Rlm1p n=1 Tax=Saccharomyces arboricola (strain H-6 / AS 2.3317 / CBS 10644) TaxID=1160507 RepID=J8PY41_SACAR|nr:rlm1p [Saccharomyces arboricola H-6]